MILPRALAVRSRHRVRESPLGHEMLERGSANLLRRGVREGAQHVPEQDMAREVIRLSRRIIRRRLSRRHEAEPGATR